MSTVIEAWEEVVKKTVKRTSRTAAELMLWRGMKARVLMLFKTNPRKIFSVRCKYFDGGSFEKDDVCGASKYGTGEACCGNL
jgi:hypothetical protein